MDPCADEEALWWGVSCYVETRNGRVWGKSVTEM
jgi:hypothetical protein